MAVFPSYSPLFTLGLLAERSQDSAIYFTLKKGKRDTVERRSFLYLDLADNTRRVSSHKRKCSILSKSTSWTCSADATSVHDLTPPPAPLLPARRRTSKDSLRSIPSPKPAPSATLPDLPNTSHPPTQHFTPQKRPASIVVTSPLSPTFHLPRTPSSRSGSISSRDRRRSRMDALACLEGRSRAPHRVPRSSNLRNNFMSFSDDEDERSTMCKSSAPVVPAVQIDDLSAFADVEDEADAVIPNLRRQSSKPIPPAKLAHKRRGTLESWFPLKSFIDLKDDDMSSWNWRSFIEIGGVA